MSETLDLTKFQEETILDCVNRLIISPQSKQDLSGCPLGFEMESPTLFLDGDDNTGQMQIINNSSFTLTNLVIKSNNHKISIPRIAFLGPRKKKSIEFTTANLEESDTPLDLVLTLQCEAYAT